MAYHGEYDVYSNDMQELYEAKWPRDSIYVWIGKIEAVNGFLLRATLSRPYKLRGKGGMAANSANFPLKVRSRA
jgi:hypothetical protein